MGKGGRPACAVIVDRYRLLWSSGQLPPPLQGSAVGLWHAYKGFDKGWGCTSRLAILDNALLLAS